MEEHYADGMTNRDELDELARREAAGDVDPPPVSPARIRMVSAEEMANQLGLPVATVRSWRVDLALRAGDLRAALAGAADDDLVMARGANQISHYVTAIQLEPQSDDGEGHATSTGGTVWLALEEQ